MSNRATLYGSVAQIATLDPGTRSTTYGSVAQIAALDPGTRSTTYGSVAQIAALDPGTRSTIYGSVAQVAALQPTAVASVGNISGPPGVAATFDGSGSQFPHYYKWTWTSIPGGSAISNGPFALPDNAAGSLMANNVALWHFDSQTTATVTPLADNGVGSLMTDNEGLYHFEGDADDTSGNARNGVVSNATQVAGKVGSNAYEFVASSSAQILLGATTDYHFTTEPFTIAGWFKPGSSQGSWVPLFSCLGGGAWNANARGYWIDQNSSYTNTYRWGIRAGGNPYYGSNFTLPADEWSYVCAVRDGATFKVYVDGAEVTSDTLNATIEQASNGSALAIGRHGTDYTIPYYWNGDIDEFAIWSRALSASEIQEIYESQNGSVTTADASGNGNSLTLLNSPTFPAGKVGNAIELDGTNQTAYRTSSSLQITGDMSLFTWVYLDTLGANESLFWCGDTTEAEAGNILYLIRLNGTGGNADYFHEYGAGGNQNVVVTGLVTAGQWCHIGFIRDTTAKTVKFYRDGKLIQTYSYSHNPTGGGLSPLYLGSNNGTSVYMDGKLDEFAIWSRALSESEAATVYHSVSTAGLLEQTATVAFTPDVLGTYTIQLEVADGVTDTANAVISAASGGSDRSNTKYFSGFTPKRKTIFAGSLIKRLVNRKIK